jgi:hypothetical protein
MCVVTGEHDTVDQEGEVQQQRQPRRRGAAIGSSRKRPAVIDDAAAVQISLKVGQRPHHGVQRECL